MEGICWECSILGLAFALLDTSLRRKSWRRGRGYERGHMCPQTPETQAPKPPHLTSLPSQAASVSPRGLSPPSPYSPGLDPPTSVVPVHPLVIGRTRAANIWQACRGHLISACLILTPFLRVTVRIITTRPVLHEGN